MLHFFLINEIKMFSFILISQLISDIRERMRENKMFVEKKVQKSMGVDY